MSDRLLTIGELARRAGVATSTLRYYEDLGLDLAGRPGPGPDPITLGGPVSG